MKTEAEERAEQLVADLGHKLRTTLWCVIKDMPTGQEEVPMTVAAQAVGFALGMCIKDGHQDMLTRLVTAMAKEAAHKIQLPDNMRQTVTDVMESSRASENLLKMFKRATANNMFKKSPSRFIAGRGRRLRR